MPSHLPTGAITTNEGDIRWHCRSPLSTLSPFSHYTFAYYPYQAAISVSESYDALNNLFERVANFLTRFHIYTEKIPLSPMMSDIMVKIMTEVLNVLALATRQLRQGRLSMWLAVC